MKIQYECFDKVLLLISILSRRLDTSRYLVVAMAAAKEVVVAKVAKGEAEGAAKEMAVAEVAKGEGEGTEEEAKKKRRSRRL